MSQALPMSFEIGYAGLATLGLVPLAWRAGGQHRRSLIALAGALVVGGAVMATAAGAPFYRALPLLQFVQLPWRFLSLISLGVAVLGGMGLDALRSRGGRVHVGATLLVIVMSVALVRPLLGPKANFPLPPWSVDPAEYRKHRETTTTGAEYLPIWAPDRTKPRGFREGIRITGDARVLSAERGVGRWALEVEATGPAKVALVDLYYPGWEAWAGDEPVPVGPLEESGHVELTLGPGRHEIEVRLEPTPFRRGSRRVSIAAVLAAFLVAAGSVRARRRGVEPRAAAS